MTTTYTPNARLQKPAAADRNWDVPINANTDAIDGMTAIGSLVVTVTEKPSTSLSVRVSSGAYAKADGTIGTYVGTASVAVPASSVTYLWLTDAGVLTTGASFPNSAHVRLARVEAGPTTITKVVDQRVQCSSQGVELGYVLKAGDTLKGPLSITSPSTSLPVLQVDPTARTIGFFGVTPSNQAPLQALLVDGTAGVASTTIGSVGASYSPNQFNNNFASLTAGINALIAAMKRHGLMAS